MYWFKVLLSVNDVNDGVRAKIQNAFDTLFIAAGSPKDAALFSNRLSQEGVELYFSPGASRFASRLIAEYGGVPCGKLVGILSLVVGNLISF